MNDEKAAILNKKHGCKDSVLLAVSNSDEKNGFDPILYDPSVSQCLLDYSKSRQAY